MELKEAKQGDVVKLEEGQNIEGVLRRVDESAMYPGSYAVQLDEKVVFVNKPVIDLFETNGIRPGTHFVKLTFNGMKKTQDGKREYKDFKVHYAVIEG